MRLLLLDKAASLLAAWLVVDDDEARERPKECRFRDRDDLMREASCEAIICIDSLASIKKINP